MTVGNGSTDDTVQLTRRTVRPISLVGISKNYGPIRALDSVSMTIGAGEIHGLCGHNGAGKSTVVKILSGLVKPDAGTIRIDDRILPTGDVHEAQGQGIALVDQERGLVPSLTIEENLFLGASRPDRSARSREATSLLTRVSRGDLDPRRRVGTLALGDRKLVEIARALHRGSQLLILDEPTTSLTSNESAAMFTAVQAVARSGTAIILVSHRLDDIFSFSNHISVLRDGRLVDSRATQDATRSELVSMMVGDATATRGKTPDRPTISSPPLIVANLSTPRGLKDVSFRAESGQIVGLAGQVGSGNSQLLRAVAGLVPGTTGSLQVDGKRVSLHSPRSTSRAGIQYVSNDRKSEGLFLGQTTISNLVASRLPSLARAGVISVRRRQREASRLAGLLGVRESGLRANVAVLSGGNQQKVLIGRTLQKPAGGVLLLDEPTQGVDVNGRAEIHALIREAVQAGNTIIFASSELDELLSLCDTTITMYQGAIVSQGPVGQFTAARVLAEITHAPAALRSVP